MALRSTYYGQIGINISSLLSKLRILCHVNQPYVVVVPPSVLCCSMFLVLDMGALLWRSQWGQWGYDRFAHHHDDHCHVCPIGLFKHCLKKADQTNSSRKPSHYLILTGFLRFCFISIHPKTDPHKQNSSQKIKSALSHYRHPHLVTWDEVYDLQWLPILFLLYFFLWMVTQFVTSAGDLWSPRVPHSWPSAGPGHSSTQRSSRHLTGQKGERTMLAPHESNQAHREHIRTSGFYLPFLFGLAKSRLGRQVCQVPQLWPSDHITHGFWDSQWTSCCIRLIQVVVCHILRSPLKRYARERFLAGTIQPQ